MAITRLFQTGFEFASLDEVSGSDDYGTNSGPNLSTTEKKTGAYSCRFGFTTLGSTGRAYWLHTAKLTQARTGLHINHNGVRQVASDFPTIVQFIDGVSTRIISIVYNQNSNLIEARSGAYNGTLLASASSTSFDATSTWYHIGVDVKIAVSGWVYVYLDGSAIISYSGDTTGAGTEFDGVVIGGGNAGMNWGNYVYYDDWYVENTTGEAAAAQVPDYRFELLRPDGNGYSSQWTGSDADSTDNYLHVDETPPDGDTSYVEDDTTAQIDAYTLGAATVPSAFSVNAAIPVAIAKKLDAGGTVDLNLGTRLSSTNSTGASTPALTTDYQMVWERQTTKPGGGSWTESDLNSAEGLLETS